MSVRNRGLERVLLALAERATGATSGFGAAVIERLDRYGREHGDTFDERPPLDLIAEIAEEALDLAGWSLLARTVLDTEVLPPATRQRLNATLDALIASGAEAYLLTERAAISARSVDHAEEVRHGA